MAIVKVLKFKNGVATNIDTSVDTMAAKSILLGGEAGTELTKSVVDTLIGAGDASSLHDHDTIYYTKTEVDSAIQAASAAADSAAEISYSNTTSGLTAANVQTALDEVEGRLQTAEGEIDTLQSDITAEVTRATTAEAALDTRLDTVETDITTKANDADVLKKDGSVLLAGNFNPDQDNAYSIGSNGAEFSAVWSSIFRSANAVLVRSLSDEVRLQAPTGDIVLQPGAGYEVHAYNKLNMNFKNIVNVVDPVDAQDGATKNYVDVADAALDSRVDSLEAFQATKGQNSGLASLDSNGKVPSTQIPQIAIVDTFVVASEAAMLALSSAEQGDVAVRSDLNRSFILTSGSPSVLANWQELLTPTDAVLSVNSKVGAVQIDAVDIPVSAIAGINGGLATQVQNALAELKSQANTEASTRASADSALTTEIADKTAIDDVTIERVLNTLRVKDAGITAAKLASNSVETAKIASAAVTAAKIDFGTGATQVKASNLPVAQTQAPAIALGISNTQIGFNTILEMITSEATAGEAITVNELLCFKVDAGDSKFFKASAAAADNSDINSNARWAVIGSAVASQTINNGAVAKRLGNFIGIFDTALTSADIGKAVYLSTTQGGVTLTPPTATGTVIVHVGVLRSLGGTVEFMGCNLRGVN